LFVNFNVLQLNIFDVGLLRLFTVFFVVCVFWNVVLC